MRTNKLLFLQLLFLLSFYTTKAQHETLDTNNFADVEVNYNEYQKSGSGYGYLKRTFGVNASSFPYANKMIWGGGLNLGLTLNNQISAGLDVNVNYSSLKYDFGFVNYDPELTFVTIGIYGEYNLATLNRWTAALRVNTGMAFITLSDASQREIYYWTDQYGIERQGERALVLAKNNLFRLMPQILLRYQMSTYISFEIGAGYNLLLGNMKFGNNREFNAPLVQAGFQFGF